MEQPRISIDSVPIIDGVEPRISVDFGSMANLATEARISNEGLPTLPSQKILRKKSVEDFVKVFQMEKRVEQEMFFDAELSALQKRNQEEERMIPKDTLNLGYFFFFLLGLGLLLPANVFEFVNQYFEKSAAKFIPLAFADLKISGVLDMFFNFGQFSGVCTMVLVLLFSENQRIINDIDYVFSKVTGISGKKIYKGFEAEYSETQPLIPEDATKSTDASNHSSINGGIENHEDTTVSKPKNKDIAKNEKVLKQYKHKNHHKKPQSRSSFTDFILKLLFFSKSEPIIMVSFLLMALLLLGAGIPVFLDKLVFEYGAFDKLMTLTYAWKLLIKIVVLFCAATLNFSCGVVTGTQLCLVVGLACVCPFSFTQAFLVGNGFSGLLTSLFALSEDLFFTGTLWKGKEISELKMFMFFFITALVQLLFIPIYAWLNKLRIVDFSKHKAKTEVEEQMKLRRVYDEGKYGIWESVWGIITGKKTLSLMLVFGPNAKKKKLAGPDPEPTEETEDTLIPSSTSSPFLENDSLEAAQNQEENSSNSITPYSIQNNHEKEPNLSNQRDRANNQSLSTLITQPFMIFAIKNIAIDIFFNSLFWLECIVNVLIPGISLFLSFSLSFSVYPNFFLEIARRIAKDDPKIGYSTWAAFLPKILLLGFALGDFFGRFISTTRICARAKRWQLFVLIIVRIVLSLVVFILVFKGICGTFFIFLFILIFAAIHGYCACRSMVLIQETLTYHQLKRGGVVMSAFLTLGLVTGSSMALVLDTFVSIVRKL